ncbi:MAG TPA: PQQ-binding-like beta-propeller repeat protein [Vicinamibacterales bacterium]
MKRLVLPIVVASVFGAASIAQPPRDRYRGWAAYGGTPDQIRYSSLQQINRKNVKSLEVAWSFDAGEPGGLQTQPIVVDGVLFGNTPTHKVFALRASTGELLWKFDAGIKSEGANRGLMYWTGGTDKRIYAAVDQYVYALDAATGKPAASFGENGRIDLRQNLGRDPQTQSVRLTTPGVVYKDLVIIGGRVSEGLPASPGDVRAYDARTGALRWSFHTIPHPGEPGYETWGKDSWRENGGANSWPGMALDAARGMIFVPTGSAAADFYGANRPGDNLYANSLIALDANTGKKIWHFQIVKHDIWDRDSPSPPNLIAIRRNGKTVDAVAQSTKHGYVFLFDRVNGTPLVPIEYRAYPSSDVPGETTAATQPIPTSPPPFARQTLTPELLTNRTPDARKWALAALSTFKNEGQFAPLTVGKQTVFFPGFDGGAEWGGQAFDPETGLYYVNANDLAWTGGLAPAEDSNTGRGLYRQQCASCHRDDLEGSPPQIPSLAGLASRRARPDVIAIVQKGAGRMPGFPNLSSSEVTAIVDYIVAGKDSAATPGSKPPPTVPYRFTGYRKFLDPDGYPAVAPPWGTLTAIDLAAGKFAWRIPLGEYPELAASGMTKTGTENYGGPIVTAGGLVFIGATNFDRKFRAFDKRTGQLLWETTLPFSGNATPATFEVDGRQFVVIAAGGGKGRQGSPSGSVYVAFALPR